MVGPGGRCGPCGVKIHREIGKWRFREERLWVIDGRTDVGVPLWMVFSGSSWYI